MIKNIATLLLFPILIIGAFWIYQAEFAPCKNPIEYTIGVFDSRFGITKEKFLLTLKESETIWERNSGINLFEYNPSGHLKINLVYDERQAQTFEASESKEGIEGSRSHYDSLVRDYKIMASDYEANIKIYNKRADDFEIWLDSYNNKVAEINSRGGAKPQEYQELEREKKALEAEKSYLNSRGDKLNQIAEELNSLGDRINALALQLNITVDIHNQRFGEGREFDQGDYQGNKINIYQFNAFSDLRLVLAHEFGHALGIDHVENPESIMYYLMDKQDLNKPELSSEDLEALRIQCEFHIPKLQEIFH